MANGVLLDAQATLTRLPHLMRMKSLGPKLINPKIRMSFENQVFEVKTVDSSQEMLEVLKLRFDIFFNEFSKSTFLSALIPFDIDMHDFNCDHLVVKDKKNNKIIACYRLLSSDTRKKFYTESEFSVPRFFQNNLIKIELGRACVHKDYRSGAAIGLLWKGLIEYARLANASCLFGCSSLPLKDSHHLSLILEELKNRNALIEGYDISVKKAYLTPHHVLRKIENSPKQMRDSRVLGSLMNMYLLAGAKFSEAVAYDPQMKCFDFLTILDLTKLPPSFERRFK